MSKVKAISGATAEEIEKLTEKAKEMGQKTKFSATESAEAFQYMAMAGWKTEDMLNGIEGIMNLAAASGEDLASVSDIVTDALTAFGLQAKDSGHFADVLAKASSNSNTNVGLMGETFKYVAPLAGSMKYSVEDTAVAIGLMANAGIKGSQAGTALRSMLTRLVKPPKDAAQALTALNISAKNSDGTMKPLSQTLQELRTKFSKLSDSQKSSYAASIAGQEAMSGMLAIVNASDDDFNKLTESIRNSDGASKEMADTMNDNVKGALTLLKSNIESVGIKLYDKIKEPLKKLINEVSKYVSKIPTLLKNVYNWVNKNKDALKTLVKIVASVTAGYLAYKTTLVAITAIQTAKNILGTVSAFLSLIPSIKSAKDAMLLFNMVCNVNPVALVVAGITALTVGIGASIIAIDKERRSLGGLKEEVDSQKKSWEELKKTREESLESSNIEIAITEKLADELKQMTDENGKVKEGYENRAEYILTELNKALGTEYTMNGNIINQYDELKNNIDQLIAKKKAEATLNVYKSEYETAMTKQSEATKTLTGLRQKYNEELNRTTNGYKEAQEKSRNLQYIGQQIEEQTKLIGEYGYTIQNYETLTSASISGNAEEINKAIKNMGISYDEMKNKTNSSLTEQINSQTNYVDLLRQSWRDAVFDNDTFQSQILQTQLETQEQELNNLAKSLAQQTSTINELSEEEKQAWNNLASKSITAYNEGLSTLDKDTRKKVEQATGLIVNEVELPNGTKQLAYKAAEGFELNYDIDGKVSAKLIDTSNALQTDTRVSNASKILATNANEGFNNNVDGKKWGQDLSDNISSGMQSQASKTKITGAATSIGSWIKSIIGHSVPKAGPLKDELTYMPDMIDNLVEGIEKNKYKVVSATSKLAEDMKKSFEIEKINDEIYRKLQNAIAIENASITAKATLEANKSQPTIIARDHTTTINNTQQFYSKESTPYEEQKQAKQQLRRLAYEL